MGGGKKGRGEGRGSSLLISLHEGKGKSVVTGEKNSTKPYTYDEERRELLYSKKEGGEKKGLREAPYFFLFLYPYRRRKREERGKKKK